MCCAPALGLHWVEDRSPIRWAAASRAAMACRPTARPAWWKWREASGLQRLTLAERDPRKTSTFGTGQLLADARARGARRAILAIGGSATNDAGIGAAAALGWGFLDADGRAVPPDGGHLKDIARLVPAPPPFESMEVLCDVTNPLFGPKGAAWIYGRQKGGSDAVLAELDDGLKHLAALVKAQLGQRCRRHAGRRRGRRAGLWRGGLPGRAAAARHRDGAGPDRLRRRGARRPT